MNTEKQTTAMQELIDYFEKDNVTMRDFYVHFMSRRYQYIAKEREQIENAFTCGNRQECYDGTETLGARYYNETFK